MNNTNVDVTPSASRLTTSLRDIGYDFVTAVADIVDNSVSAGASRIDIVFHYAGEDSHVLIADDGIGMTQSQVNEALRFGSRRAYGASDLGRFGLGLKTASISQCRRLTVVSRRGKARLRLGYGTLDLDHIVSVDRWEITPPPADSHCYRALEWLEVAPGTVVIWEKLDRVLPTRQESGWARRRLDQLAAKTADYLGMVFHRFIEGTAGGGPRIDFTVNGEKVHPWNPFAPDEPATERLPRRTVEVTADDAPSVVSISPYVLPARDAFSTPAEFERLAGPLRWNRQQGLYVYRADRMVQSGGWSGLRAADEHTKLARASLDFPPALDTMFRVNVAKMRVVLPTEIRTVVGRHVQDLCQKAETAYRHQAAAESERAAVPLGRRSEAADAIVSEVGAELLATALEVGEQASMARTLNALAARRPDLAAALGWE